MNQLQTVNSHRDIISIPVDCYSYHVKTFLEFMNRMGITDPMSATPIYFKALNESNYSAGTIRMKRASVKNRLRLLADTAQLTIEQQYQFDRIMSRLDRDPDTKPPKLNKAPVRGSKVLEVQDYRKVLEYARSERQKLFIQYLWTTGCRISEMTSALLLNCKVVGYAVEIRIMGKGRKERQVRIPIELFNDIKTLFQGKVYLFETSRGKKYTRSYVSDQIGKLTLHILGRRLSAHCLRHSFATRQIARTHKISAVSKYMGHSSPSITLQMYTHEELSDLELFGELAI